MTTTLNASTSAGLIMTPDTSGILQLQTANTTAVTIDGSQNVGIGTSSPDIFGRGHTRVVGISTTSGNSMIQLNGGSGAYGGLEMGANGTRYATITASSTDTSIGTNAAIPLIFSTNNIERTRIDSSGNVGMGTSSPATNLHVNNATGGAGQIRVTSSTAGYATNNLTAGSGIGYVGTSSAHPLGFVAGNSEVGRFSTSGELLIGCTTLPTSGNSNAGVGVFNESGTGGRIQFGKTVSGTQNGIANYYNGTYVGGITYTNTATALVASSDERLKENIVSAPAALEKAMAIEVVSYDWKHDPTHVEYGLVAQRLNAVYPEAVNVGDNGEEIETTWGVEYGRLTPLLLKAIQEQQAIIQQLTARIETLEAK